MKNEKINYNQKVNNDCVEIIPFTQKVYISAFKNCYTPQPAAYGKLIYWLVMTRFKDRVIAYRKCKDPQRFFACELSRWIIECYHFRINVWVTI